MRKIKLFPAPHLELRVSVSDEMERDYWECDTIGKLCDTCSWKDVKIGCLKMCEIDVMEQLLEENHGQINTPAKQRD